MCGLEVVGSIASVVQLAGAVYAISKTLYEVGDALSNAPSDIKDLARDLETFSEELHLLSSLLDGKHRYSDRVYSLTAKIIGDCATICVKIDRILKKLRSGSVWARVKWLYKEKEIMKLLTRLRDLKLSLMGVLSMLGALKADHMLDAMGVPNKSLLEGEVDEKAAVQAKKDIEETRRKLADISTETSGPSLSHMSSLALQGSWNPTLFPVSATSSKFSEHKTSSNARALPAAAIPHALDGDPAMSTVALFPASPIMQMPAAMDSVQSFHSAVSHQTNLGECVTIAQSSFPNDVSYLPQYFTTTKMSPHQKWRAGTIESAANHFQMTREQAEAWADSVSPPRPGPSSTHPMDIYAEHETRDNSRIGKGPPALMVELEGSQISGQDQARFLEQGSRRTELGPSTIFSEAPQYHLESPDLQTTPSPYSKVSELSTGPSAPGSAHPSDGRVVPVSKWPPPLRPSIQTYSSDHSYRKPTGMDDYALDLIVPSMPSLFGRYTNDPKPWSKTSESYGSKTTGVTEANLSAMSSSIASLGRPMRKGSQIPYSYYSRDRGLTYATHGNKIGRSGLAPGAGLRITSLSHGNDLDLFQRIPSGFSTLRELNQSPIRYESVQQAHTQSRNDGSREVRSYSIPPPDQTKYLWWTAFLQLREHTPYENSIFTRVWLYFENAPVGWSAAKVAEHAVADMLIHLQNMSKQSFPNTSNQEDLLKAMSRIREILQVMKDTLAFDFGALAWLCLSGAIQFSPFDTKSADGLQGYTRCINDLADIATLIARYNILESIYQQWSGMSLDEEYESSIIALCKLVLQYLADVLDLGASGQSGPNSFQDQKEQIAAADLRCRGFTTTFLPDQKVEDLLENESDMDETMNVNKWTKRSFENFSDDLAESTGDQVTGLKHSTSSPGTPKSALFKRVRSSKATTVSRD